jgi:hypothetical protein
MSDIQFALFDRVLVTTESGEVYISHILQILEGRFTLCNRMVVIGSEIERTQLIDPNKFSENSICNWLKYADPSSQLFKLVMYRMIGYDKSRPIGHDKDTETIWNLIQANIEQTGPVEENSES